MALPTPPSRGMTPDAFNDAAEAFMAALDSALGWTTIETIATTSGTSKVSALLPSTTYNDLLILIAGVSFTASANLTMALGDGPASFATAQAISAGNTGGSDTFYGSIFIPGYRQDEGMYLGGATPLSSNLTTGAPGFLGRNWRIAGGIDYFTFAGGTFDAGSIIIQGRQ
jgi:hypothetical protein